jgi:hypothetical protein
VRPKVSGRAIGKGGGEGKTNLTDGKVAESTDELLLEVWEDGRVGERERGSDRE